uniref:G-protein coupled receptors family 3 profile domain-containing protein n=1 Tax=Mola mola TaxID=94237 RepID=A0A3Q3W9M3_MOLML
MEIRHFLLGLCAFCLFHRRASAESTCNLKAKFNLSGYKDVEKKKVVIGGMFPIHNKNSTVISLLPSFRFNFRTFRWTQAMLFAINEINKREDLLPNTDLGYVIYDSCFTISKAVEGTLTYLTGQDEAVPNYRCGDGPPLAALVGAGGSDLSIATARILGLYHFPQVSYSSTCSALESKFQFPTFLRTIPNDKHQSTAIAKMVLHFGWTWVGTIAADDDYGKYGIKDFKEQVEEAGVCISFSETLPKVNKDIQRIVQTVVEATAKIIVVFSSDVDLSPLITELLRQNVTNRTWIATEAWVTSLGSVNRASIPGFQRYLLDMDPYTDPLTEEFWETVFMQVVSVILSRLIEINRMVMFPHSVYKAVYAVAHALHNLEHCKEGQGPFNGKDCADITDFEPWQLMYYLKNVRFKVPHTDEEIYFDKGDVEGFYEIINWQFSSNGEISYVIVGHYNGSAAPEDRMNILNDSIVWNSEVLEPPRSVCSENCQPGTRKGIRQGEPVCCFDCIPCADGEISNTSNARECILCGVDDWSNDAHDACVPKIIEFLAFGEPLGITFLFIALLFLFKVVFIMNVGTPLVKANDALLSFSLLFSLVVTFLCSIFFLGQPQNWSCMTSQVALALGFAFCLSSIMIVLVKFRIRGAFYKDIFSFLYTQGIACGVWLIMLPPHSIKNTSAKNIKIILECDEGSVVFICCIFSYDILLALLAFIFAFIARKLEDNFSEGKCITFGMLVFFIVWISFVPAYLSTRGKFMVAVQIFAILASSFGLLTCIFLPKCYILLVKPECNTEEMMRPHAKTRDGTATGTSASLATAATEVNATISSMAIDD